MTGGTAEFDVVVVGGGMAGFSAAVRAAELGLRTVLLEKSTLDPSLSNSRAGFGGLHAALLSLSAPPAAIYEKIMKDTDGTARPDVVSAFAEHALSAVHWLAGQGVEIGRTGPSPAQAYVLIPPSSHPNGLDWDGNGPDKALRRLKERFLALGGAYCNGCRARELILRDACVVGINVEPGGQLACGAVILADGGFQANPEMVDRYIAPGASGRIKLRAVDTGTGDGIQMAEAAGAKLHGMETFYGHCLSLDSLTNDRVWPYPVFDGLEEESIIVWRRTGERFLDEGMGGIAVANAIARAADPQDAVIICDDHVWTGAARLGNTPANPNLIQNGGSIITANTIADLAPPLGIDPGRLTATVEQFNRAVDDRLTALPVPRTRMGRSISRPPFHAIPVVPGMTYTMGGILIDGESRVLDQGEQPIPGLWAAGVTTGGLEGGPRAGYAGGLSQALVFGKLAAESIRAALPG